MPSFDEFKSKKAFKPWNETILQKIDPDPIVPQNKADSKKTLRAWDEDILDQIKIVKPVENKLHADPKQPDTNLLQSDYKPTTNLLQSGNKVVTNWEQSGNKAEPETGSKVGSNWGQSGVKVGSETGSKVVAKWEQSGSKLVAEKQETGSATGSKVVANFSFSSLIGLQKKIILFLYESCKTARSKITNPISLEHMSDMLKATTGTIKSAIRRLENKQLLTRAEYKNGRGGWSKYLIPEHLFQELLQIETGSKVVANWYQSDSKVVANWEQTGSKVVAKPVANPPLVASSNINTTSLHTNPVDNFPADWQAINYEAIKNIGFGPNHILQLYKAKLLSAQLVQESIDSFAFTLLNYPKAKEYMSPLNVLMSVLAKGNIWERRGAPPALAVPLNAPAEQPKQSEEEAEELSRLQSAFEGEYFKWWNNLRDEEIKQLFPDYEFPANQNSKFCFFQMSNTGEAMQVFRKTKWPEIYNEICAKTSEVK